MKNLKMSDSRGQSEQEYTGELGWRMKTEINKFNADEEQRKLRNQ